ncbi:MAG: universal stress protein [Marinoscillum sp.]|uniref:universal stress protein n=1 Tax=Marinoscillum sp. TaxID=2024838 RepID=UPI0032F2C832
MYKYNKILVGLDHTETDLDLVKAASDVCELSGSKVVYFVNIIRDINLPEKLMKEFPHILDQAIEERRKDLQKTVHDYFKFEGAEVVVNVIVDQGQVTKTLLKHASTEKIDLVILGRKNEKKGGGVLVNRIARRVGCSLLILPKGSQFSVSNVLVPTDFSAYSRSALEKATMLVKKSKAPGKIIVQNVYQVPVGYHYTGKSFKEFSEIMKDHAKNDFAKFTQSMKLDKVNMEQIYTLDKDEDIISDIYKAAKKIKASLIIIGAKGRTATTALFIGSKAEKLIHVDEEIPMLVVRPKGKNAGIIEYIKEL